MIKLTRVAALGLCVLAVASAANAQGVPEPRRQMARDAWARTDPAIAGCIARGGGSTPDQFAANGMGPNDPSLANHARRCVQQATPRTVGEVKDAPRAPSDPAIAAILGPDPKDVVVLAPGQDTPRVIRDMQGNLTFPAGARVCPIFGRVAGPPGSSNDGYVGFVVGQLESQTHAQVAVVSCFPKDLTNYELVAFTGEQVAVAPAVALAALAQALRDGKLMKYTQLRLADYEALQRAKQETAQAEARKIQAERAEAREQFVARRPEVFSAIYLEGPQTRLCLMKSDAPRLVAALEQPANPFAKLSPPGASHETMETAEQLFLGFKRKQCGVAIASTGALTQIFGALRRDLILVEVAAAFLDPDQAPQTVATPAPMVAPAVVAAPAIPSPYDPIPSKTVEAAPKPVEVAPVVAAPVVAPVVVAPAVVAPAVVAPIVVELADCSKSPLATDFYTNACIVQGMAAFGKTTAPAKLLENVTESRRALSCTSASLTQVEASAKISAGQIRRSGVISELMDFDDAIQLECRKAAKASLK